MNFHIGNYLIELHPVLIIPTIICVAIIATSILAVIRIIQRAGYSGWWILITLIPGVNLLALWYFGFGPWPAISSNERP